MAWSSATWLDFEDGEIRYKTSIDVEGDRLSPAMVQQLVYANVLTMHRYLPGIMRVIYGNVSPAEATAEIEGWEPIQSGLIREEETQNEQGLGSRRQAKRKAVHRRVWRR
jgi:hypothetical protein